MQVNLTIWNFLNFYLKNLISFSRRHRNHEATITDPYAVDPASVTTNETSIQAQIENKQNRLKVIIALLEDSRIRLFIDEAGEKLHPRFHSIIGLDGEPKQQK